MDNFFKDLIKKNSLTHRTRYEIYMNRIDDGSVSYTLISESVENRQILTEVFRYHTVKQPNFELSVKGINLSNLNINVIPDSISNLKNLECLILSHNFLTGLPDSICEIKPLKYLMINDNSLNSLPERIGNLSNLKRLYLSNNLLVSLPVSVCNLIELEQLALRNNFIEVLPKELVNIKCLRYLPVSPNPLADESEKVLGLLKENGVLVF